MFDQIQSPYGKIFYLLQKLCNEKLITPSQKGYLKDLIIEGNDLVLPLLMNITDPDFTNRVTTPTKSWEINEIETFLMNLLLLSSSQHLNHDNDNPQQGLPRFQTNTSVRPSSNSKSFQFGSKFVTNQDLNILNNVNQMKDDSIVEFSMNSESKLLMNSKFCKNSMEMEMSQSLIKSEDTQVEPQAKAKVEAKAEESEEDDEEDENEEYEEGGFNDYYKNIEDEYNLPSIKDLSRMESNQIFMTRSSVKPKHT